MISETFTNLLLPVDLLSSIKRIDEFNGTWKATANLSPDRLSSLQKVATIESIGASTRIEGVTLTNSEIETFLQNLKTTSFKTRDEQEVAGYSDLMAVIFDHFSSLDLTENHINQLHSILLKYSTKDENHRGEYKKNTNSVGAFIDGKLQAIIFETASPFETPLYMEQLIRWYDLVYQKNWHPLVIIAIFIVTFLAIHPFQDGNGRLSRALTTLLLLKTGYLYVPFSSLEGVIEDNKRDYYKALQMTQKTLRSATPDYLPWMKFFFTILEAQISNLTKRTDIFLQIQKLSPFDEKIVEVICTQGKSTISDLTLVMGENRNTIKSHLFKLVHDKVLKQNGQGKGTFYTCL